MLNIIDRHAFIRVTVDKIIPLRREVFKRYGADAARFLGDTWNSSLHLAALPVKAGTTELCGPAVCCATFMPRGWQQEPALLLRGMATSPSLRRHGLGTKLLCVAEELITGCTSYRLIWCNADLKAISFYRKLGWTTQSDVLEFSSGEKYIHMMKQL